MIFTLKAISWLETILYGRFGQKFTLVESDSVIEMSLPNSNGLILFDNLQKIFHQSYSDFPCDVWDAAVEGFDPVLDQLIPAPGNIRLPLVEKNEQGHVVHYDVLGLTYWMLSRQEEVGRLDLDDHERFPAVSSHAFKHGYLERPIVDEWLHILGQITKIQWPNITLKKHMFDIKVSHDVDSPSQYAFTPWSLVFRMMVGHLIKRRDIKAFFTAPIVKLVTRKNLNRFDPFNTFNWIMDLSEQNGLKSAFYFICGRSFKGYDAEYELEHPVIRNLINKIHKRGHEIGLHPSYNTFYNPELIAKEALHLRSVCSEVKIKQKQWGGRMHYLRWKQPDTLYGWEAAGMDYDSTLSYADRPGFRCGTCHEYPAFDPVVQKQLKLRIRPLIVMDSTIIDSAYLGLGLSEEAHMKIIKLKNNCQAVDGCFTFLWHNSNLSTFDEKKFYNSVLDNILEFRK